MMPAKPTPQEPGFEVSKEALGPIKKLIREKIGLTFDGVTEDKLSKSLLTRIHTTNKQSFTLYHQYLRGNLEEFEKLTELLTINETFFYRESAHLDLLTQVVIPMVRKDLEKNAPIKIMSVGCSTGEEAYSIAIALWELFGAEASEQFEIVAGDLDKVALKKAETGQYGSFSFRGVPPHITERYFDILDQAHYCVKPHIKKMVTFYPFNLLSNAFKSHFTDIDIMFYRNVSIYFDEETRKGIIERLNKLLRPNGFLIMGSTETLANDFGVMGLISKNDCFFFSKQKNKAQAPLRHLETVKPLRNDHALLKPKPLEMRRQHKSGQRQSKTESLVALKPQAKASKTHIEFREELDQILRDEGWDEAARLLSTTHYLTEKEKNMYSAFIALYRRQFDDAKSYAQKVLLEDEWSVDAQVILGLSSKYQEDFQAAAVSFKRAVYLQKGLWLAHYYLADCLRQLGQTQQSLRSYSLVMELIGSTKENQRSCDNELSLPFNISVDQVRFLCELHMNTLKGLKDKTHGN